jgi:hypothetical protein
MTVAALPPVCDARVARLLEYWRSIRPAEHRFPGRRHVEPTDLPELLRWLWLVDVQQAPLRFRCRLVGTGHREMMGKDCTGFWIDEVFPDFTQRRSYADFAAAAAGEPRWYRGEPDFAPPQSYVGTERLMLPLAADGETVDMLLGLTLYTRADGMVA